MISNVSLAEQCLQCTTSNYRFDWGIGTTWTGLAKVVFLSVIGALFGSYISYRREKAKAAPPNAKALSGLKVAVDYVLAEEDEIIINEHAAALINLRFLPALDRRRVYHAFYDLSVGIGKHAA